jgi:hypothetical protein
VFLKITGAGSLEPATDEEYPAIDQGIEIPLGGKHP